MADQSRDQGGAQQNQDGGGSGSDARRNPADNLSREDRVRGGERSASMQQRDQRGQFAGRKNKAADEERGRGTNPQGSNDQGGRNAGSNGSHSGQ